MNKRTYVYNVVLRKNDVCPQGELLTGKELERINLTRMPKDERNKSIKCESFTICCRLNLSGLQENKLMNMQQEWA